ncbi:MULTISPECIES: hypothetical protein [unclassified Nocardioides]|uniref:hypothetical protein n=1 Tax=unclassified Nocardioides TaxID=2615069 RepID=UPI0030141DA5
MPTPPPELGELALERVRERISAYVYGNILVLAALATTTPHSVEDGHAALVVIATTATTFLAHVLAHLVAHQVGADHSAGGAAPDRSSLRDALPIASSGSVPALILLVAWLGHLPPTGAVLVSAGVVVVRLAGLGMVTSRFSGRRSRLSDLWMGLVLAVLSGVVVLLKVWLTH